MGMARFVAHLPLSLQENTDIFTIWIEPVVYLTAQAYYPTAEVQGQLKLVQRIALELASWGLTAPILAEVKGKEGVKFYGLHTYALWVHSFTFVQFVKDPWSVPSELLMVLPRGLAKWAWILQETCSHTHRLRSSHTGVLGFYVGR